MELDIIIGLASLIFGGIIGFYTNKYFSIKNSNDLNRILDLKFGPQIINVLTGEEGGLFKKYASQNSIEKEAIGKYIASRWGSNQNVILLDAGTTTERVARYLSSMDNNNSKVFTANPIAALHFLSRRKKGIFLFSGELDINYGGTISTTKNIENFITQILKQKRLTKKVKVGIVGSLPLSPEIGPCSDDKRTLHIKKTIIELCDQLVIAVDFSKFKRDISSSKHFPVFENPDDWKNILWNNAKRLTIVTAISKKDVEKIKILEEYNVLFNSTIHIELI